ncbi:hypothetical protein XIS1_1130013 [Xenorhabdus innexi]|uniref:Uncharacterized protein n=1 Tax=Xenorhabdus innexi TaxID=290109 RepID=A0A1N6MR97_9GAMM|nr:hypothetical protein XIS1_1130013 [Xenorhabdus innexi]
MCYYCIVLFLGLVFISVYNKSVISTIVCVDMFYSLIVAGGENCEVRSVFFLQHRVMLFYFFYS